MVKSEREVNKRGEHYFSQVTLGPVKLWKLRYCGTILGRHDAYNEEEFVRFPRDQVKARYARILSKQDKLKNNLVTDLNLSISS